MFTGIVEEVGTVKPSPPRQLVISAATVARGISLGDSIAVNGACLTIISLGQDFLTVELMPETIRRTNLGEMRPGDKVNLERALTLDKPLGGHLVQGHIDAQGRILLMSAQENAVIMRCAAPPEVMRYIVEKGFITVDGVSLTAMGGEASFFEVSLVSHTLQHTTFSEKRPGNLVNLEVDIVAKYVEHFLRMREGSGHSAITLEFLAEHGFSLASQV